MTFLASYSISIVENLKIVLLPCVYFLSLVTMPAHAEAGQNFLQQEIMQAWSEVGGDPQNSEIRLPNISQGFQLPDCHHKPELFFFKHLKPGRNSLEVKCQQPFWQQAIALDLISYQNVLTLQTSLQADKEVESNQVALVRVDVSKLKGTAITEYAQLKDKISKRHLKQGTPLTFNLLKDRDIVSRGQPIKAIKSSGPIQVEITATALANGHRGELIRIRNERSGQIMKARVISADLVEIQ